MATMGFHEKLEGVKGVLVPHPKSWGAPTGIVRTKEQSKMLRALETGMKAGSLSVRTGNVYLPPTVTWKSSF